MPSVVTTSDAGAGVGYTGIRIRGVDGERINVTINGIPVNDPESHGVWWVNMPDLIDQQTTYSFKEVLEPQPMEQHHLEQVSI